jgi:hypothetical protein
MLCRVPCQEALGKEINFFKKNSLPSALLGALGKAGKPTGANGHFAECNFLGTRQSDQNRTIYLFFTFSSDKQNISHIFHITNKIYHEHQINVTFKQIHRYKSTSSLQVHLNKSTSPSQVQISNTSAS